MPPASAYATLPAFVLGFHGCDESLAEAVFRGDMADLNPSNNDYDWLGTGIYFWENNYQRAIDWACAMRGKKRRNGTEITRPAVIGAIINPGHCLDFMRQDAIELAKNEYQRILDESAYLRQPLPKNTNPPRMTQSPDRVYRKLDRAVVEAIHMFMSSHDLDPFDTVRAVFLEGNKLYPDAGFLERTHIQLCVRTTTSILGYFRPRA